MKLNEAKDAIKFCYSIKEPLFMHSSPGIGKSSIGRQAAEELSVELGAEFGYIDERCASKDPADIGSVLYVDGDKSKFTKPDWIPQDGHGIIILDELSSAPPLTQASLYQLVLDRELGGVKLGKDWYVIAAGNLTTDKAVGGRLSTALANRFMHIDVEEDVETTVQYATKQGWHPVIGAFLRFKPQLLMDFDPKRKSDAWASPRTWEKSSKILKGNPSRELRFELLNGTIGAGPAAELEGFLRLQSELPNIDDLLQHPKKASVPDSPATLYAVVGAIAHRVNAKNFDNVIQYALRMPTDMSALLMMDCVKKDEGLASNTNYVNWCVKNHQLIL